MFFILQSKKVVFTSAFLLFFCLFAQSLTAQDHSVLSDTIITYDPVTKEETIKIVTKIEEEDEVEKEKPEKMPEFPGGQQALIQYMIDHINYPKEARKGGREAKVIVSFIVWKDGSIRREEVKNHVDGNEDLEAEAIRVIRNMPNWTPAEQRGKKVAVQFNLPIVFKLTEKEKKKAKRG